MWKDRWIRSLGVVLGAGLGLSACVIRPGGGPVETAPAVEQFASSGEALEKVSTAGVPSVSEAKRARNTYAELLEELDARIAREGEGPLLVHEREVVARTLAFYDEMLPLLEALAQAPVDSRPGITADVYAAQRRLLESLATLYRELDLPTEVVSPLAVAPAAPVVEESLLGAEVVLDEEELQTLYDAGERTQLISKVSEASTSREQLSPRVRALYARALAEEGLTNEALVQAEILAALPLVSADQVELRLEQPLWLLAAGQGGAAERALRTLVEDTKAGQADLDATRTVAAGMLEEMGRTNATVPLIDARRAIEQEAFLEARAILTNIVATEGTPTDVKNRAEAQLSRLAAAEDKAFERRLMDIRQMGASPGRQTQAKAALDDLAADFPDARFAPRIQAARGELEGTVSASDVSYLERLEGAKALLAANKYEQAATEFEALLSTPVSSEAKAGRDRAVDLYVQQVREETARDYLAAKKISVPQKRLEALVQVYDRMVAVTTRYPDSRMTPKIASHMQVVKSDILKIDPAYFDR